MRALSEAFRARLASGATTLAHAWRVRRADGAVRGFTDHDRDLTFGGVTYRAATGLAGEAVETQASLGADAGEVSGVLSVDGIDEDDLRAGLWDGARVDVWRIDWSDPSLRAHLFAGRIGEVRAGPVALLAELRGLQGDFDAPFGRVFSRFCDAQVGDARCGVDLSASAFRGAGTVTTVEGLRTFYAAGIAAFADGWFARGMLTWSDGSRAPVVAHRVSGAHVMLELGDASPALAVGAAFTVTAGCDKRFATCRTRFANAASFRGFPHMPGNDAVVAGADMDQPRDGGSRYGP